MAHYSHYSRCEFKSDLLQSDNFTRCAICDPSQKFNLDTRCTHLNKNNCLECFQYLQSICFLPSTILSSHSRLEGFQKVHGALTLFSPDSAPSPRSFKPIELKIRRALSPARSDRGNKFETDLRIFRQFQIPIHLLLFQI